MPSLLWVGEPGDRRCVAPAGVEDAVGGLVPVLTDDVAIVLPPVPELVIAVMACHRLCITPDLVHPLDELSRVAQVRVVLTSSALVYRGDLVFLKERVHDVGAERVLVHDRAGWMPLGATMDVYHEVPMRPGRDDWLPTVTESGDAPAAPSPMPSLREIANVPAVLMSDDAIFLFEGHLEPDDAERAQAVYVGASGTSLGSRPGGRVS